ncbi:hypothetical protein B0H16DRAFT_1459835 [Mycena metata]|uniref:Zn(2)-C6 fungal-type domain-containing protein n=1 Tax=Mycena metata TaxID=1033252 RepID=A0AAD7NAY8_9AGAR|nr:hypothetical protein B0H16DRAFT_1459835 [Mycena metata]
MPQACISDPYENKPCERCARRNLRCEYVPVSDGGEESATPTSSISPPPVFDRSPRAPPAPPALPGPRSGSQSTTYAAGFQHHPLASRFEAAPLNTNPRFDAFYPPITTPPPRVAGTYYTPPAEYPTAQYQPAPPFAQYNTPIPAQQHTLPAYAYQLEPQYDPRLLSFRPPPPTRSQYEVWLPAWAMLLQGRLKMGPLSDFRLTE